jgi:hypothetical protein
MVWLCWFLCLGSVTWLLVVRNVVLVTAKCKVIGQMQLDPRSHSLCGQQSRRSHRKRRQVTRFIHSNHLARGESHRLVHRGWFSLAALARGGPRKINDIDATIGLQRRG